MVLQGPGALSVGRSVMLGGQEDAALYLGQSVRPKHMLKISVWFVRPLAPGDTFLRHYMLESAVGQDPGFIMPLLSVPYMVGTYIISPYVPMLL